MTNISHSFALKGLALAALALLAGCGASDGSKELAAGKAAYDAGNVKRAEALFTSSLEANPTNADAHVYMALVNLQQGLLQEARAHALEAESLAGGDVDVRLLSAQIAWHLKDYEKAARIYRAIAEDVALPAALRARAWTELGLVQMAGNAYDLARLSFLRALRLDFKSPAAHYHLGVLYRYAPFAYAEAALEQFEIFVRLSPEMDARIQKTCKTTIPALKETIARQTADIPGVARRNSASSVAALARADKAWKKNAFKTAVKEYRAAYEADPLAYPAARGLARALLKADTSRAGQKQALDAYRKACALRPSAVATFVEAGALAERLGQVATAREIYSRALAADPASVDVLDGLVRALRKTGDKKVAAAYQAYRESLAKKARR